MRRHQLHKLQSLMPGTINIGTRGSKLALWQANWVKSSLKEKHPSLQFDLVVIKTTGDKILDTPLAKLGGKGLFVKEIEEALLDGRIDLAVHSMKDMPSELPKGTCIGAIPVRETSADVLISRKGALLSEINPNAKIGTSSLRRAAQLRHVRPDIEIVPLRGNLDTRLRKLETDRLDAIVLAAAGVKRLNFEDRITEYLDETIMLPAVGQGALCIEIREKDIEIQQIVKALDHPETRIAVTGERSFLNRLGGSCQVPIAGYGKLNGNNYILHGLVADIEGTHVVKDTLTGEAALSEKIGLELADRLISKGAKEILENLKADTHER